MDHRLDGCIRLSQGDEIEFNCLDIASLQTRKALLWHAVEIRARSGTVTLPALSADAAAQLAADLYAFINAHLFALISTETDHLHDVDTKLRDITEGNRQYLAQADLGRAIASVPGSAAAALSHPLLDPQLMPAGLKASLPASFNMLIDPGVRHAYNESFVRSELLRFQSFFDDLDGRSLSDQQREACIRPQHAESKRQAYRRQEIDFFETTSAQASDETLLRTLEAELTRRSVPFQRKSYAEITKALEPVVIKHYHKLISICIKHIRASHLTLDMLLERAKTLHDKERARLASRNESRAPNSACTRSSSGVVRPAIRAINRLGAASRDAKQLQDRKRGARTCQIPNSV